VHYLSADKKFSLPFALASKHFSPSSFIVTLSLIRRTACARAQFSGCSSTINTHSERGKWQFCCQNLTLGEFSNRSALSVLVGALFKKLGLFLNTPRITSQASELPVATNNKGVI
jgi:hypothetical protein